MEIDITRAQMVGLFEVAMRHDLESEFQIIDVNPERITVKVTSKMTGVDIYHLYPRGGAYPQPRRSRG